MTQVKRPRARNDARGDLKMKPMNQNSNLINYWVSGNEIVQLR